MFLYLAKICFGTTVRVRVSALLHVLNMDKYVKYIILFINIILFWVCVAHISMNAYFILYPPLPDIRVSKENLHNIDFPLAFKLCVTEIHNISDRYQKVGYYYDVDFFKGKSMYNDSIYGWKGHTANGSTIASVQGKSIH